MATYQSPLSPAAPCLGPASNWTAAIGSRPPAFGSCKDVSPYVRYFGTVAAGSWVAVNQTSAGFMPVQWNLNLGSSSSGGGVYASQAVDLAGNNALVNLTSLNSWNTTGFTIGMLVRPLTDPMRTNTLTENVYLAGTNLVLSTVRQGPSSSQVGGTASPQGESKLFACGKSLTKKTGFPLRGSRAPSFLVKLLPQGEKLVFWLSFCRSAAQAKSLKLKA